MPLGTDDRASPAAMLESMRRCLDQVPAGPVGVALSGGGDSVALTLLLKSWCDGNGRELHAVTVDHGLRDESAQEAEAARILCETIGVDHQTLVWQGWQGTGNLQDAARTARRRLIGDWARQHGIGCVALGHTRDDQAETFLMRLARGSGVDGLSAMKQIIRHGDILWFRPLLGIPRETLRTFLRAQGTPWSEDPSNLDDRFDRIRAREALQTLAPLGIGTERLIATAAQMARARAALEYTTLELARKAATPGPLGDVLLDPAIFAPAPEEIRLRLLAASLMWVAGEPYRPRLHALSALNANIGQQGLAQPATLHGCILRTREARITIRREPGRTEARRPLSPALWDQRWQATSQKNLPPDCRIGALGDAGLAQWPHWRDSGFDREVLLASPALWDHDKLLCALARDSANNCPLCLKGGSNGFFDAIYMR